MQNKLTKIILFILLTVLLLILLLLTALLIEKNITEFMYQNKLLYT